MPDFLFVDTEFGGLPDARFHWSHIGLTQISAAAVQYPRDWSTVEIEGFFDTHIKPVAGLLYEDVALAMQSECVTVRNRESKEIERHYLEADAGHLFEPGDFGEPGGDPLADGYEEPPSIADVFFCWLSVNGRDEATVLRAFKNWSVRYFGLDSYKVSCWAHNVEADLNMITAAIDRCFPEAVNDFGSNDMLPCNRAGRCSMILFRILRDLGLHNRYKANLDTLVAFYGVEVPESDRHTSRGDVIATVTAIGCMMRHLRSGVFQQPALDMNP